MNFNNATYFDIKIEICSNQNSQIYLKIASVFLPCRCIWSKSMLFGIYIEQDGSKLLLKSFTLNAIIRQLLKLHTYYCYHIYLLCPWQGRNLANRFGGGGEKGFCPAKLSGALQTLKQRFVYRFTKDKLLNNKNKLETTLPMKYLFLYVSIN